MHIDQTQEILVGPLAQEDEPGHTKGRKRVRFRRAVRYIMLGLALWFAFASNVSSSYSAIERRNLALAQTVSGWEFDFLRWELSALSGKVSTAVSASLPSGSSPQISSSVEQQQVINYVTSTREIGWLEQELNKIVSTLEIDQAQAKRVAQLQTDLAAFRQAQQAKRPVVEQIIEGQVSEILSREGFGISASPFPPVQFAFAEPPKKMVVSRRDQIGTVYAQMVDAEIGIDLIEQSEQSIYDEHELSAYITNIGGLGTYPAMVVDRASFPWILSTVAHEWVHNYLNFFPLGLSYMSDPRLTTINETVAEIVGEEIGGDTLHQFYPELVPPPPPAADSRPELDKKPIGPPLFDFRAEMRETRLVVDRLLGAGLVEETEAYMEMRRLFFVENGTNLRVLNQAYFAFHGSYATSPTSVDPIGPKLYHLRELLPDVQTFLQITRWFTSVEDLDAAIAEWERA